ncbi:hypothetical protein [Salinibacter ruber]|uniref:hypothetical protein n=1 Tax=Salinibacter ruber TaxID=146919 RepID=UPI00216736E5|nr:hypothetical protein [Salinibacter ruber]MCS3642779.1 hypothetical protein [Salinibacter ruber]
MLAEISRDDFVLCQVTSNPYADPNAVELTDEEFAEGGLKRVSYARPGKLFTANLLLFERGGSAHGETENRNRRTGRSVAPLRELVSEHAGPCPHCGHPFQQNDADTKGGVVLTAIDIGFNSWALILLKAGIAAVPAVVIASLLYSVLTVLVAGGLLGLRG